MKGGKGAEVLKVLFKIRKSREESIGKRGSKCLYFPWW